VIVKNTLKNDPDWHLAQVSWRKGVGGAEFFKNKFKASKTLLKALNIQ
jgi:hypothetical protein